MLYTVAPSNINPYSGMNASYGSAAVVGTLGPQTLDTISRDVYTDSGDLWQQQQSMLCENMQAHHASEANGITGSMTLGASGHTNGTSRALLWQRDDDGTLAYYYAQVRVEDQIRNSMTSLWPSDLPLVIHPVGISTLNVQEWIQKNHAPVSRISCAPATDNNDFNDLVKSLRNCGGYATAWWEAGGSYQARLLLAPLGTHLLCVAFPVKGIPEPPTSRLLEPDHMKRSVALSSWTRYRPAPLADPLVVPAFPERPYRGATHAALIPQRAQPQRWTQPQPQADYPPLDTTEPAQVDHDQFVPGRQAITFPLVCVTPPSHLQLGQQGFSQAPLQQPNAQQSQQVATSNMLIGGSQPDDWQMDAGVTSWWNVYPSDGHGTILPLEGNSGTCLDIGENTTGYFTDVDMDAIFGDTDAFESSASLGLDVGDCWTHEWS